MAVVILLLGIWWGGHPSYLPGFLRDSLAPAPRAGAVNEAIGDIADGYFRSVPQSQLVSDAISGAVAGLDARYRDPYSQYVRPADYAKFSQPASFSGVGISASEVTPGTVARGRTSHRVAVARSRFGLLIDAVYDDSPARRAGLHTGDVIVAVDGRTLLGVGQAAADAMITGPPGTDVTLSLRRGRALLTFRVTRETITTPVVESGRMTVGGVPLGYIRLATFAQPGAGDQVRAAVSHLISLHVKGFVLDLRGNGGGLVDEAQEVASVFLPSGVIVTTRGRTQPTQTLMASGDAIARSLPLVVLVDGGTASASEIVIGALHDHHRATIVGTRTFGKGVFQEVLPLPNGGALSITAGEYFTPDGSNLGGGGTARGAGIQPDVVVSTGVDAARGLAVALRTLAAMAR